MSVVIETTIGDITVDLYLKERPNTCLNFLKLCKMKYYNLCLFYKVERNFVAQTGDPSATGRGGESVFCHLYGDQAKYFDSEFKPRLKHEKFGTLSMVNNGNNMNGSQFFLTLGENLTYLDNVHTVFGEVAEGFDILMKFNEAICDTNNRPYQDIRITHTVVLHDPYDDPTGLEIPDMSPEPTKEMLESNYIGADEEIDDTKGKTAEEIEEKLKESEAKARATILEMVGDIPDADVKPPETVLFVCKLNPVTTSEDLEIIFSRFGTIVSCEVIKDKKTGESLQYAFIEFEKEEDCENAYFKMDNVLIDDRRIHVDFSQSVSKMYYKDKFPKFGKLKTQNLVLKNRNKSDGYDMIFDVDDSDDIIKSQSKNQSNDNSKYIKGSRSFHDKSSKGRRHSSSPDISRNKSTKVSKEYYPIHGKNRNSLHEKKHHSSNHSASSNEHEGRLQSTSKYSYAERKTSCNKYLHSSSSERSPSSSRHHSSKKKEYSDDVKKISPDRSPSKKQYYDRKHESRQPFSLPKKHSSRENELRQYHKSKSFSDDRSPSRNKSIQKHYDKKSDFSKRYSSDERSPSKKQSVHKHLSNRKDESSHKHSYKKGESSDYSVRHLSSDESSTCKIRSSHGHESEKTTKHESLLKNKQKKSHSSYSKHKSKKTKSCNDSSTEHKSKRKQYCSSSLDSESDSSSDSSHKHKNRKKSKKSKSSHKKKYY